MGRECEHCKHSPGDGGKRGRRRRIRARHIALLALAIAVGHVIYAALRDHWFNGSPILQ